jgi:HAD superfamily hydrolase (TIGR01450 family)
LIAEQFDAFFFDMDGVIYVGGEVLPHVIPALERLRAEGKPLRFVTNNPCPTRDGLISRLHHMGIEAYKEEVFTAAWATCLYLQQQGIRKVYSIGSPEMLLEMAEVGISETKEDPEAVVLGCETLIDYEQLTMATRFIRKGARFVATMVDAWFPDAGGPAPATGALVAALQASTERYPEIIGKPAPGMFWEACLSLPQIERSRVVMIGDNPMSDILGAHRAGLTALMISRLQAGTRLFPGARDLRQPDAYIPDLAALFDERYTVKQWEPVGYEWPQRVLPAVAALVMNEAGEVLIFRREGERWQVPQDFMGPGESVEEAVRRVVRSQTGLEVRNMRLGGVYSDPESQVSKLHSGEPVQSVVNVLTAERGEGEPVMGIELAFVGLGKVPEGVEERMRRWVEDGLRGVRIVG